MKLLDIYQVIPLGNGLLEIVLKDRNSSVAGSPAVASANTRVLPAHAFWQHRIDGDEPLIDQLFKYYHAAIFGNISEDVTGFLYTSSDSWIFQYVRAGYI